jgi:hypothetical protein
MQQHKVSQPEGGGTTTTSHESWFQRFGKSCIAFVIGWILMWFSVPVLWLNEKRSAKHEALIDQGEADCRSIEADKFDEDNTHWLVHVNGETASMEGVKDPQFNVSYESGVIALTSTVEIFQWKEVEKEEKKEEEDNFGGGKTTKTRKWKEYHKQWLDTYESGENFEKEGHKNNKPAGLEPGTKTQTSGRVEYGKGFLLDKTLTDNLIGFKDDQIDALNCEVASGLTFKTAADKDRNGATWYYSGTGSMDEAEVGDVRVRFSVLRDGPVTVLALQTKGQETGRGGFLPYRVIARPMCSCLFGLSEDEEKQKLYEEANKSSEDISDEDAWHGPFAICCCACNLVQFVFNKLVLPEILFVHYGQLSKDKAIEKCREAANMTKWVIRLVGWLLMYIGCYLIFSPFLMMLRLIPLGIGGFLSDIAGFAIAVMAFASTATMATLIIAMAYTMYNPAKGLLMWALFFAIIIGFIALCNALGDAASQKLL